MGGLLGLKLAPCAAELPALHGLYPGYQLGGRGVKEEPSSRKLARLKLSNRCFVSKCVMSAQSCVRWTNYGRDV
jgi:hypothetical protein